MAVGIEIEDLVEPVGNLKLFYPQDQDDPKLGQFVRYLMKKDRYVSDELRNYDTLWQMVFQMFYGKQLNIVYELGDFQGLIGFLNVVPEWKCRVMFKIWDKKSWTKETVRNGRKLLDRIFNKFQLLRMESHTADPKMEKLGEMFGFTREGTMYKSFKWNKKIYDLILLSKIREE